jgi:hypothetical protein
MKVQPGRRLKIMAAMYSVNSFCSVMGSQKSTGSRPDSRFTDGGVA